ncbi:MAG: DJ-1/PfpI family protein [Clostridia bacterium]|nr:DJ-1/PfpI family protein [Clostridia bacterium]
MIYVFLADGFEETEALVPVDILRRCGADVVTVGVGKKIITGSHKIPVTADITDTQASFENLQAVILPGGMPGTLNLEKSQIVQSFIDYAIDNGLYVCAICAAPSILGHKNLLQGKEAVCFPGFEKDLYGAKISEKFAAADGNIITAKGAGAAMEFGLLIASKLCGEEIANKTRKSMQCP